LGVQWEQEEQRLGGDVLSELAKGWKRGQNRKFNEKHRKGTNNDWRTSCRKKDWTGYYLIDPVGARPTSIVKKKLWGKKERLYDISH